MIFSPKKLFLSQMKIKVYMMLNVLFRDTAIIAPGGSKYWTPWKAGSESRIRTCKNISVNMEHLEANPPLTKAFFSLEPLQAFASGPKSSPFCGHSWAWVRDQEVICRLIRNRWSDVQSRDLRWNCAMQEAESGLVCLSALQICFWNLFYEKFTIRDMGGNTAAELWDFGSHISLTL